MRTALAVAVGLISLAASMPAGADPYRWCAVYASSDGGTNCYFMTLEQCRAAVSGVGGFCQPNNFYTGATDPPAARRKRQPQR
jgi:hypothetical protein